MWGKWHEKEVEDWGNVKVKIETGIEGRTPVLPWCLGASYTSLLSLLSFSFSGSVLKIKMYFVVLLTLMLHLAYMRFVRGHICNRINRKLGSMMS